MSNLYQEHKKLAARVQELEDTIFKMKKYYEDALQNLSDDNFSASFVSEKRGMKSQISMTAEAIKTMVTNDDFTSKIEQTASQIRSEVTSVEGDLSSSITQTANEITQKVESAENGLKTLISTNAEGITALAERVSANESNITEFKTTADGISTSVKKIFTDVVVLDEDWSSDGKDVSKMYQVRGGSYHYYDDSDGWTTVESNTILSLFQQTTDGFKLIGDFSTTTNEKATVSISGTRIDVCTDVAENGNNLQKMSLGTANRVSDIPVIIMGAGDDGESSTTVYGFDVIPGQGLIVKDTDHFGMRYYMGKRSGNDYYAGMWIFNSLSVGGDGSRILLKADEIYFDGVAKGLQVAFG